MVGIMVDDDDDDMMRVGKKIFLCKLLLDLWLRGVARVEIQKKILKIESLKNLARRHFPHRTSHKKIQPPPSWQRTTTTTTLR
jgi:hypothetical protein